MAKSRSENRFRDHAFLSTYVLAVELLLSALRACLPALREEAALLSEPKKIVFTRMLDRLETALVRVESMNAEEVGES